MKKSTPKKTSQARYFWAMAMVILISSDAYGFWAMAMVFHISGRWLWLSCRQRLCGLRGWIALALHHTTAIAVIIIVINKITVTMILSLPLLCVCRNPPGYIHLNYHQSA